MTASNDVHGVSCTAKNCSQHATGRSDVVNRWRRRRVINNPSRRAAAAALASYTPFTRSSKHRAGSTS